MSSAFRISRAASAAAVGVALILVSLGVVPAPFVDPPWREEVPAEAFDQLRELSGRVSREQLEKSIELLDPHGQLKPFVNFETQAVRVTTGMSATAEQVAIDLATEPSSWPRPGSLSDLRVFLDPGHHGGAWSELEGRHIVLKDGEAVREGELTYATAVLLQRRLQESGATVFLSRGSPPEQPFPHGAKPGFDAEREAAMVLAERLVEAPLLTWRRLYPSLLGAVALERARRDILRDPEEELYTRFDLRQRAALAVEHRADVTLSLHYNTAGLLRRNRLVAFIHGHAMKGELATPSQRFWAIRRALEGSLPASAELAGKIMEAMQRKMGVGFIDVERVLAREVNNKVPVDPERSVYGRNLAMVRRPPGVAVLVEGPCMDTPAEYRRLQDRSVLVEGKAYPRRVRQYSDAVFEGLAAWLADGSGGADAASVSASALDSATLSTNRR